MSGSRYIVLTDNGRLGGEATIQEQATLLPQILVYCASLSYLEDVVVQKIIPVHTIEDDLGIYSMSTNGNVPLSSTIITGSTARSSIFILGEAGERCNPHRWLAARQH